MVIFLGHLGGLQKNIVPMVVMQWILNSIKKGQLKTFWLDTYSWHENTGHIPGVTGSGMGAILSTAFL